MLEGGFLLFFDNITEKVKAIDCNGVEILSTWEVYFWMGIGEGGVYEVLL